MFSRRTRIALASAWTATLLGACASSNALPPVALSGADAYRVTLPDAPQDVEPCLRKAFPEIPDRALTKADLVGIVGAAKLLDRAKSACGLRAVAFIKAERAALAR